MFSVSRLLLGLLCACIVLSALLFVAVPFVGEVGIWALGGDFALRAFALCAPIGLIVLLAAAIKPATLKRASLSLAPFKKHSSVIAALAAFVLIAALATVFAWNSSVAFFGGYEAQQGFIAVCAYVLLVLTTMFIVTTPRRLLVVSRTLVYTAAIVASFALLEVAGFRIFPLVFDDWAFARGVSTMTNPHYLGSYLLIPCLVALGLVRADRSWQRVVAGLCAVLIAASLLFTLARGAWAGLFLGLSVWTIWLVIQQIRSTPPADSATAIEKAPARSNWCLLAGFWAGLAAVVAVVATVGTEFASRIGNLPAQISSIDTGMGSRFLIWQEVLAVIAQNPVLGVGPDNLFFAWQGVSGPAMLAEIGPLSDIGTAHNYYLDIAAATGILGVLSFFALIVLVVTCGLRTLFAKQSATAKGAATGNEATAATSSPSSSVYLYSAWFCALCGMLLTLTVAGIRTPLLVCFYLAVGIVVGQSVAPQKVGLFAGYVQKLTAQFGGEARALMQLALRFVCIAVGAALSLYACLMLASAVAGNLNTTDAQLYLARSQRALAIAPWRSEPLSDKLQVLEWLAASDPEGNWNQQALDFAQELNQRFPHNASYLHLLSVLRISDTASSLAFANRSLELRPTYLPAQLTKGLALVNLGSDAEGIALLEAAVAANETINPNWRSPEYLETLILVHLEQDNQAEAQRLFQQLARDYPDSFFLSAIQDMLQQ
ncbi:MAG: O-antigen ligase family protein [Coriobacteriia bacterium]|nr:O-antigen ligase family protein [Coriobacteriia bacterium]